LSASIGTHERHPKSAVTASPEERAAEQPERELVLSHELLTVEQFTHRRRVQTTAHTRPFGETAERRLAGMGQHFEGDAEAT